MADYNSSLPVRTQGDANEKLQTKLVDFTNPALGAQIDNNGDVHTRSKIVDEVGNAFSNSNPLPVTFTQSEGVEVHDYEQGTAVAAAATSNHDYSVASGVTFLLGQIVATASSKAKFELQIGDGAVSETFTTLAVAFNSTANPNAPIVLTTPKPVLGTVNTTTVRVIRTNLDNQAQYLYTTIVGVEV